jgi:hypothetical protein
VPAAKFQRGTLRPHRVTARRPGPDSVKFSQTLQSDLKKNKNGVRSQSATARGLLVSFFTRKPPETSVN